MKVNVINCDCVGQSIYFHENATAMRDGKTDRFLRFVFTVKCLWYFHRHPSMKIIATEDFFLFVVAKGVNSWDKTIYI